MTSMLVVVPIMGQLHETKGVWGALLNSVEGPVDLLIIDNAPEIYRQEQLSEQHDFLKNHIGPHWPGKMGYDPQDDNIGLVLSLQHAYDKYDAYELYAFLHNDLFIYKRGWDQEVIKFYKDNYTKKPGLIGFFGAEGLGPGGGRFNVHNNMLEAEVHGWRTREVKQIAVLDGLSMIASRPMLNVRGGVDTSFDIHHFYDLDLSLESIDRGFTNWYLPVPVHHWSGITANRPIFNEWANKYIGEHIVSERMRGQDWLYQKNLSKFRQKWDSKLPWRVGQPWR